MYRKATKLLSTKHERYQPSHLKIPISYQPWAKVRRFPYDPFYFGFCSWCDFLNQRAASPVLQVLPELYKEVSSQQSLLSAFDFDAISSNSFRASGKPDNSVIIFRVDDFLASLIRFSCCSSFSSSACFFKIGS